MQCTYISLFPNYCHSDSFQILNSSTHSYKSIWELIKANKKKEFFTFPRAAPFVAHSFSAAPCRLLASELISTHNRLATILGNIG